MDVNITPPAEASKGDGFRWVKIGIVLAATGATVLFLMPISPIFPCVGLDPSWIYALNEAVARHLVFGRDIVFTCGPLGSVLRLMYHPATDSIMLFGSALIGAGFSVGCALLAYPRKPMYVVILPFLVTEIVVRDCIFTFLPFVLLLLVFRVCAPADNEHHLRPGRLISLAIVMVTCSVAVLPLVKGTFASSALFSGGLSFLVLFRHRPSAALLTACSAIGAISGTWIAIGQPIGALPTFFIAQGPIISGYSEAMSLNGAPQEAVIYVAVSIVLLAVFYKQFARRFGRIGIIAVASFAFTLFIVFKAGFVRQPEHSYIAAGALLLAGYSVSAMVGWVPSLFVWAMAVFGWAYLDRASSKLDIAMACQRVQQAVFSTYEGIKVRASTPQQLRTVFERQNAAIRAQLPLPRVEGTVDLYPYELSTVFAHNFRWAPRPVFQKYSAYDARLDALDVGHLEGANAPQHVFFQVGAIDERLPTLEDSVSWPVLLTRYQLVGRAGNFLRLDRYPGVINAPEMEEISASTERLGRQFNLPNVGNPVWAEANVRPTLLGRIFAALFKPPELHILFRHRDGHTETFRYVAAMGRAGFIILPLIHDTSDFGALLTQSREQYFSGAWPTSVQIAGEAGTHFFWESAFAVHLRHIKLPVQPEAEKYVYDQFVYNQSISDATLNHKLGGSAECWIDAVNRKLVTIGEGIDAKGPLLVQGWATVSAEKGIAGDKVFVVLTSDDGKIVRIAQARAIPRPDVNAHFKHAEMGAVGFEAFLDAADLKGKYRLQIYVERQNTFFAWPNTVEIRY